MAHTPSVPEVKQPASATDPRYSTSGILNAQVKEKNRQGLLSTFGGRTGKAFDINKFANEKNNMRDPSAVPALEQLMRLYADAKSKGAARGVSNDDTSDAGTAASNIHAYNRSVDAVDNFLASYGAGSSGLTKGNYVNNFDTREFHSSNYGAGNKGDVAASLNNAGNSADTFNKLEQNIKKNKKATS